MACQSPSYCGVSANDNAWFLLMPYDLGSLVLFMIKRWATLNRYPRSF